MFSPLRSRVAYAAPGIARASELVAAAEARELVHEARRIRRDVLLGDLLVVLELVDQHRNRPPEHTLDHAVAVQPLNHRDLLRDERLGQRLPAGVEAHTLARFDV